MTLIATHVLEDEAFILTDTMSYTHPTARSLGHTTKVSLYPHLDMATASQGLGEMGVLLGVCIRRFSDVIGSFDELSAEIPRVLAEAWPAHLHGMQKGAPGGMDAGDSTAFMVGYSEKRKRFVGFGMPSEDDFRPFPLEDGLFVIPSPLNRRPSGMELARLTRTLAANPNSDDEADLQRLAGLPVLPAPTSNDEWVQLANDVRGSRALALPSTRVKTIIGGRLFLTYVGRGMSYTQSVGAFNDSGDDLAALVAGTAHPLGLAAPCPYCDSGKRFLDCHATEDGDKPCVCGSGALGKDCCVRL